MAKVNLDLTTVTEAEILAEINKVEAMLEGRLDEDNIQSNGTQYTALGKANVTDIADYAAPVHADKFFAHNTYDAESYDFRTEVFDPLLEANYQADVYSVLSKKITFTLDYKNQKNLEKPDIIVTGGEGVSYEAQQRAIKQFQIDESRYFEEVRKASEATPSFGAVLGSALVGGFSGAMIGGIANGGNPLGIVIGAYVGMTAGAVTASIAAAVMPGSEVLSPYYDSYSRNVQIVFFSHTPNFRMVKLREVIREINRTLTGDGSRFNINKSLLGMEGYAVSAKFSCEQELDSEKKSYKVQAYEPYYVDAETTAVAMTILPEYPDENLITNDNDYITFLADVEILYRDIG